MGSDKRKGDFGQWQRKDMGGNKKSSRHARDSRTSDKQNTGHGGR